MNAPARPVRGPDADDVATERPRADSRRTRWLLLALLTTGVCVELVLRSDMGGMAGAGTILALAVVLLVSGEVTNRPAQVLLGLAPLMAVFLVVRASEWLLVLNAMAALGLLGVAALLARRGDLLDLAVSRLVARAVTLVPGAVYSPLRLMDRLAVLAPLAPGNRDQLRSVMRGVGLAVPLLAVLGLLLASADAVFASFFSLPLDPGPWLGDAVGVMFGIWVGCALLWAAVGGGDGELDPSDEGALGRPLGATEVTVVLGGLVGVYGLFAVAQLVAARAGDTYILETTGLTAAEHARSGFFQLLWAAGITLVVLLGIHRLAGREVAARRSVAVLNGAAAALTMAVVAVAISRLGLYEDAFGLTMLRVLSTIFAWWLGVVFVAVGIYLVVPWRRTWWPAAVAATGLATLVVVNLMNPERVVAEHNIARTLDGRPVDVAYLAELSDDAVPVLAASLDELPVELRDDVEAVICDTWRPAYADEWFAANRAERAAAKVRDEICV
ncbi:MAG: DUF4173 domain-containing protein [Acidimicrobiia bacterium]|nr:DUF4173 domain-containing protein [Acidimicrobiia bacterium]